MAAVVVEVGEKRELAGVTFPNQILPENVRGINLLRTSREFVEIRIGVFLKHVEPGDVVLPAVVVVIAENPDAEVRIVENETAEIAHERLNAGTKGNEIIVVRQIAQVEFAEGFLQRPEFFFAGRAVLRIWIHHVPLLHLEVVVIVNAEHAHGPIDRLERGLALEKIDTDREIVRPEILLAPSEKLGAVRQRSAHPAWRRKFARFELEKIL